MTFSSYKTVTKRLSLAVTVLLFTLFVVSCANPAHNNTGTLLGTWTSTNGEIYTITGTLLGTWTSTNGEIYTITGTTFQNFYQTTESYSGNNLSFSSDDNNSGYIFFTYTRSANPDWTYSDTAPDVGKWYAVHYKNLTSNSVSLSGAAKTGGKSSTETLSEAITEFTVENGYFSGYSECSK